MKFSTRRLWTRLVWPNVLLVIVGGFAVYNLAIGLSPDHALLLEGYPKAEAYLEAHSIHVLNRWVYASILMLGLAQGMVFLANCLPPLLPRSWPVIGDRRPWHLRLQYFAVIAQAVLCVPRLYVVYAVPNLLFDADALPDRIRFETMIYPSLEVLLIIGLSVGWGLLLGLRLTRNLYYGEFRHDPEWGDRVLEDLRTHGQDPPMRKGTLLSLFSHVMVIVVIPWLLQARGCVQPYYLPEGSGEPVAMIVVKYQQKKKKKKRIVLNMNSAIIFHKPEIDESKAFEEMDKLTQQQYEATKTGKMGTGGGTSGGWPDGMKNAPVRFIRLKYTGGDWHQQFGEGADYNFLIKFAEETGFRIAEKTEAHEIVLLKDYPDGNAPPFVYLTGSGNIGTSSRDIKILRKYLLEEGGMIFADCGGAGFDRPFRNLMAQVLPGKDFVRIAHDDIIFQQPYQFPDGAPERWHHAGRDALGIKHDGRWVVFYHPGDINDAWQTGHSGVKPYVAQQAYRMGFNVVYYAFTNYYRFHHRR